LTEHAGLRESCCTEEQTPMTKIINASLKLKIWNDNRGQDLTEYALMAGFLAAASAFTLPQVASAISTVLGSVVAILAGNGTVTAPGA
jgi:Flp pilus assembly pilin Flp